MARKKYSGSKYMKAAQSFGDYQKSVFEAISHTDYGKERATAITDSTNRQQQIFGAVAEGMNVLDSLNEIKKTESTVEDSVAKYEEFTGKDVDYSKVNLMDVVKGDAKLADYGKESFKFGSDTYTKEEMIAFGKKADTNKFNKMLGIEADDLKTPSHESSGWKYGQTKEDIQGIKDAKADVDAKVKAGQERLQDWKDGQTSDIAKEKEIMSSASSRPELKMRDVSSDIEAEEVEVPKVDAPGSHMGNRKGLDFGDIYGENSMWSKIGSLLKKPKEERLTEEAIRDVGLDETSIAEAEVEAETPKYGDEMEKYLDKDWKFGEDMDASDYTLGFSGKDDESGTSSFNLYDKQTGKDYGKMFDVIASDDSKLGYALKNKHQSFFGSQKVGEWGGLFENESLQHILKGYRS